jgi:predicted ester cyclase
MDTVAVDNKQLIREYLDALSGHPKTEELLERFISDPALKEHIRQAEAAFPEYEVLPVQMVAEGDTVALRCTFRGIHKGDFAGIAPTGKQAAIDFMIFYRLSDGMIVEHWMQLDFRAVMDQLTA